MGTDTMTVGSRFLHHTAGNLSHEERREVEDAEVKHQCRGDQLAGSFAGTDQARSHPAQRPNKWYRRHAPASLPSDGRGNGVAQVGCDRHSRKPKCEEPSNHGCHGFVGRVVCPSNGRASAKHSPRFYTDVPATYRRPVGRLAASSLDGLASRSPAVPSGLSNGTVAGAISPARRSCRPLLA